MTRSVRSRIRMAGMAAVAVSALALPSAAAAAPPPKAPTAHILGVVNAAADGETATVRAKYLCNDPETALWVSVKQVHDKGARRNPALTGEGSGALADAWLHSHRNPLTCDGRARIQEFDIDKLEWGQGALETGQAWAQFCMSVGEGEEGEIVAYPTRWVQVRRAATPV